MSKVHNDNADYKPKGSYEKAGDFEKAYVIGTSKTHALICVYDIFGFWPQTEQGADILASSIGDGVKVIMPDFLKGHPWDLKNFPPKSSEEKKKLQEFFGGIASPPENLRHLVALGKSLRADGYQHVSVYGFCWGGKVAMLSGSKGVFDAVALVHPAMLSVDDVKELSVPLAIFPSKDEPVEEVKKILAAIKEKPFADKCVSKTYSNMHHGWAAARGDLKDADNKAAYEDVYKRLAAFFHSNF